MEVCSGWGRVSHTEFYQYLLTTDWVMSFNLHSEITTCEVWQYQFLTVFAEVSPAPLMPLTSNTNGADWTRVVLRIWFHLIMITNCHTANEGQQLPALDTDFELMHGPITTLTCWFQLLQGASSSLSMSPLNEVHLSVRGMSVVLQVFDASMSSFSGFLSHLRWMKEHSALLSVNNTHDFTPSSSLREKCDGDELQWDCLLQRCSTESQRRQELTSSTPTHNTLLKVQSYITTRPNPSHASQ